MIEIKRGVRGEDTEIVEENLEVEEIEDHDEFFEGLDSVDE